MGFPDGHPLLVESAAYYNAAFNTETVRQHWRWQSARLVTWYPALAFVRGRIVDLGCGPGHFAEMCRDFGHPYIQGIDFSTTAVNLAKQRIPEWANRFQVGDLAHDSVRADADTYVVLEVLEHIYDDLGLLRRLPKGKTVVGSVPSFHTPGHCRWFTSEEEVRARYSQALRIDRVVREVAGSNTWFVWSGVIS